MGTLRLDPVPRSGIPDSPGGTGLGGVSDEVEESGREPTGILQGTRSARPRPPGRLESWEEARVAEEGGRDRTLLLHTRADVLAARSGGQYVCAGMIASRARLSGFPRPKNGRLRRASPRAWIRRTGGRALLVEPPASRCASGGPRGIAPWPSPAWTRLVLFPSREGTSGRRADAAGPHSTGITSDGSNTGSDRSTIT